MEDKPGLGVIGCRWPDGDIIYFGNSWLPAADFWDRYPWAVVIEIGGELPDLGELLGPKE